jgi:hypothetical protein
MCAWWKRGPLYKNWKQNSLSKYSFSIQAQLNIDLFFDHFIICSIFFRSMWSAKCRSKRFLLVLVTISLLMVCNIEYPNKCIEILLLTLRYLYLVDGNLYSWGSGPMVCWLFVHEPLSTFCVVICCDLSLWSLLICLTHSGRTGTRVQISSREACKTDKDSSRSALQSGGHRTWTLPRAYRSSSSHHFL